MKKRNPDFSEADCASAGRQIGVAAIRYFMLKFSRGKLIVFDMAEALSTSLDTIERIWARLRQIEPAGLFARTVAECLGAQLAERDRLDPAMKALLDNLDLVAAGELGQLRRRCGVD